MTPRPSDKKATSVTPATPITQSVKVSWSAASPATSWARATARAGGRSGRSPRVRNKAFDVLRMKPVLCPGGFLPRATRGFARNAPNQLRLLAQLGQVPGWISRRCPRLWTARARRKGSRSRHGTSALTFPSPSLPSGPGAGPLERRQPGRQRENIGRAARTSSRARRPASRWGVVLSGGPKKLGYSLYGATAGNVEWIRGSSRARPDRDDSAAAFLACCCCCWRPVAVPPGCG